MSPKLRRIAAWTTLATMIFAAGALANPAPGRLEIVHLDAGQGDGAVIISPLGQVALIDEGTNFTAGSSPSSCARVLSELQALGITHVDLHFASHYHADHIGCISNIVSGGITIDAGWDRAGSLQPSPTVTYNTYVSTLGSTRHTLAKGQVFTLDSLSAHPVTIKCIDLAGCGLSTSDENSLSVVLQVSYGEFDELFGGDLQGSSAGSGVDCETRISSVLHEVGPVEVYKVHHHGSAYSSNQNFLGAIQPKVAVVPVGTGNPYGHPTATAMNNLHSTSGHPSVRTYWTETGSGVAPNPTYDKVANGPITIFAGWQAAAKDTIEGGSFVDTFNNSGTDAIPPTITLNSPNGGETVADGSTELISWSASDNVAVTDILLDYSLDSGTTWTSLGPPVGNGGLYGWSVPSNMVSTTARVRVTARDAQGNTTPASSAADFTIADQTAPQAAVTSPNGGESWDGQSNQTVTWNASDNVGVDSVNVDYSLHGAGGPWVAIAHGIANSGSTAWTLPPDGTDSALVRVAAYDHALNQTTDPSDNFFHINPYNPTAVGPGHAVFALARPAPNPSASRVALSFSLATASWARLEILDVSGRRVWDWGGDGLAAGSHGLVWDGRSNGGHVVGQGLYFLRLTSAAGTRTERIVRMP